MVKVVVSTWIWKPDEGTDEPDYKIFEGYVLSDIDDVAWYDKCGEDAKKLVKGLLKEKELRWYPPLYEGDHADTHFKVDCYEKPSEGGKYQLVKTLYTKNSEVLDMIVE